MTLPLVYFLLPLLILTLISWYETQYGLFLILAAIPAFLIRTQIFFIPSTWLELSIYTVFIVWLVKCLITLKHKNTCPVEQSDNGIKTLKPKNIKTNGCILWQIFKPYILPIALFVLAALLSTLISKDLRLSLGILKAWIFDPLLFLLLFLIVFFESKTLKEVYLQHSIYAITIGALAVGLFGLIEYAVGFGMHIPGRLDSIFITPNYVSMYLSPIVVLTLGLIIYKPSKQISEKLFLYFSLIILLLSFYLTKSYSGWFALLASLLALWFFLPWQKTKYLILVFVLIFALPLLIYEGSRYQFRHYNTFWQISSKDTRQFIWQTALDIGIGQPILGLGLGGFRQAYQDYIKKLPKLPPEKDVLLPHNLYLNLWLEMGVLGLTAFLWIIIIFFTQLWRPHYENAFISPISPSLQQRTSGVQFNLILACAMLAILIHGLTDTPYFKNDLSLLFWFLIGLERISAIAPTTIITSPKLKIGQKKILM